MAVGDVYLLSFLQTYAGQRIMNTLAFTRKTSADPTVADATTLANDWKDVLRPHQLSTLTYNSWVLQQVHGSTVSYAAIPCRRVGGVRLDGPFTGTVIGTLVGDGLPPQTAMVTTLKTGLSGRSRRGRHYMGGMAEGVQLDGIWQSGYVAGVQAVWDAQLNKYKSAGTNLDWGLGVWSNTIATGCRPNVQHPHAMTPGPAPSPGTAFQYVTSLTVRNIAYTQRRRTIGVGQ